MNDSKSWIDMQNSNFIDIINKSNIQFDDWKNFQYVLSGEHKNSLLKPVNNYVNYFGIKPDIVKIKNGHYSIRYRSYSEIFLYLKKDNSLYAVEKSWLRQFYLSPNLYEELPDNVLSKNVYRFFIPWFLDQDIEYSIKQSESNSVKIIESKGQFNKSNIETDIKDTGFVDFYFTNSKEHMINKNLGLIKRGTPLYEIHLFPDSSLSDIIESNYV